MQFDKVVFLMISFPITFTNEKRNYTWFFIFTKLQIKAAVAALRNTYDLNWPTSVDLERHLRDILHYGRVYLLQGSLLGLKEACLKIQDRHYGLIL